MILDEIQIYLESISGLGLTKSVNLFATYMPDSPDDAVSIYSYAGLPPTDTFGLQTTDPVTGEVMAGDPAWTMPRLQVVVRSLTAPVSASRSLDIYRALHVVRNQVIQGVFYMRIHAQQEPYLLERDQRKRVTYVCNYQVEKRLS